ncbi:MAG: menaquinone biosynthesis protein [Desulfuromonadales bacterium]|nr:menaquinone biosynthesis protein [Desulfuromonadales bacterium]
MKLRIGEFGYVDCCPFFSALKDYLDCTGYQFVQGIPAELNNKLRTGKIDASPLSSIEYAKSPQKYVILPEFSLSSVYAAKSVLLFSRMPIFSLDGQRVALSKESDTSATLLQIILKRFYGFHNTFIRSHHSLKETLESFHAMLLVGDAALKEAAECRNILYVYDLGTIWYKFTSLPFVFALWILRKEVAEKYPHEVAGLVSALHSAKTIASGVLESLTDKWDYTELMGNDQFMDYGHGISYDLSSLHIESLKLFYSYAAEIGKLSREPELNIYRQF